MRLILIVCCSILLSACTAPPTAVKPLTDSSSPTVFTGLRVSTHRDGDDLLSGGLGHAALLLPTAPAAADPAHLTAAELRRRALHANWRAIADVYGTVKSVPTIPGREFHAFALVPGAQHRHRVMAQIPDAFDAKARCLIVTAVSGSRGIYGAIGSISAYGLPRGCAVVHTDKGGGTGFFDVATGEGAQADGTRAQRGGELEFDPDTSAREVETRVAMKHAHSGDNPEADWGRHVLQAAHFGMQTLNDAFPAQAPFTAANTRVLAFGLSNGAGAVLRAAELDDEGLIDAVVAAAPNVTVAGARPLFDYATEAALLQPCALLALPDVPALLPDAAWRALAAARCASLQAAGLVAGGDSAAQAASALAQLRASGWRDETLQLAGMHLAFDLWRALGATYAQSYARASADAPVCGFEFAQRDGAGPQRAATALERALWWSDASGIAPTAGVALVDTNATATPDPGFQTLQCLRALWTSEVPLAQRVRVSITATRATALPRVPTVLVHGDHDSLVPIEFNSRPYAAAARSNGAAIALWEVAHAQHFDAFVLLPQFGAKFPPLLPHAYAAMDALIAHLDGGPMPVNQQR